MSAREPACDQPNFLGIGMQKTGTTWLYHHLRRHPDVYLPPRKELRHLMEIAQGLERGVPCKIPLFQQMRSRYNRGFITRNAKSLLTGRLRGADLRWDWKHLVSRDAGLGWYLRQFEGCGTRVRGEISPQYHQMGDAEVAAVAQVLPDLSIVLLLRHPVDQIWSQARMVLAREQGKRPEDIGEAAYRAFFDHWRKINSDYVDIIDRWSRALGEERVFVGFYDELLADPAALFARVCGFLGVAPQPDALVTAAINRGDDARLPESLRRDLEAQWVPCVETLVARYPALEHWLDREG